MQWTVLLVLCWFFLWYSSYLLRPLWPIDETRYVSVAWEMWHSDNFLVPHLNGAPYPHKPPLLFWLIHLGWALFGVNEWWPRLVPSLFGLMSVFLLGQVCKILWPEKTKMSLLSSLVLMGSVLWAAFCTVVMFDLLLSFFVLLAIVGGIYIIVGKKGRGVVLMGIGLGLGILSKGPVVFVHTLPVLLIFPYWAREIRETSSRSVFACFTAGVIIGIGIALLWVIPAVRAGGEEYKNAILWGQTAHRVTSSFAHSRPLWWYLPWLPVLFCPWILFVSTWKGWLQAQRTTVGLRFCLTWIVSTLIIFSFLSGKQVYYLLPMLPGIALLLASGLSVEPETRRSEILPFSIFIGLLGMALIVAPLLARKIWLEDRGSWALFGGLMLLGTAGIALMLKPGQVFSAVARVFVCTLVSIVVFEVVAVKAIGNRYDLTRAARIIKAYEEQGRPIAYSGKYHGQFHFLGRLERPFQIINDGQVDSWLASHPDGRVIAFYERPLPSSKWKLLYTQPFRSSALVIFGARAPEAKETFLWVDMEHRTVREIFQMVVQEVKLRINCLRKKHV